MECFDTDTCRNTSGIPEYFCTGIPLVPNLMFLLFCGSRLVVLFWEPVVWPPKYCTSVIFLYVVRADQDQDQEILFRFYSDSIPMTCRFGFGFVNSVVVVWVWMFELWWSRLSCITFQQGFGVCYAFWRFWGFEGEESLSNPKTKTEKFSENQESLRNRNIHTDRNSLIFHLWYRIKANFHWDAFLWR